MARTALTVTGPAAAGLDLAGALAAANLTDGNSLPWGPRRYLRVVNGAATALTVTVQTPVTVGTAALAVADLTITVAASADVLIGPIGPECRRTDGTVWVDYTGAAASVTATLLDL